MLITIGILSTEIISNIFIIFLYFYVSSNKQNSRNFICTKIVSAKTGGKFFASIFLFLNPVGQKVAVNSFEAVKFISFVRRCEK